MIFFLFNLNLLQFYYFIVLKLANFSNLIQIVLINILVNFNCFEVLFSQILAQN